jgi:N-acetylglucosaminyldiphosphoundecaprenol N-acetyl-beta-D-mannosaminyltransferase
MESPPRFNVLGVGVHALDYEIAVHVIIEAAQTHQPLAATALAVHGVMTGRADSAQCNRLNALDLIAPDGQPVRWALNWLHGTRLVDRVYGPFLMLGLCERAASEGLGIFLYGSDRKTLDGLAPGLQSRFPGLRIVGTRPSRFRRATEPEWAEDAAALRASGADLVFCGLGCPRQESWVYEMRNELNLPLVAVGAAFAFWSGQQPMAPVWMQRAGLEWAFRFSREPTRLWHRYLIYNPLFIAALIQQKFQPHAFDNLGKSSPPPHLRWS